MHLSIRDLIIRSAYGWPLTFELPQRSEGSGAAQRSRAQLVRGEGSDRHRQRSAAQRRRYEGQIFRFRWGLVELYEGLVSSRSRSSTRDRNGSRTRRVESSSVPRTSAALSVALEWRSNGDRMAMAIEWRWRMANGNGDGAGAGAGDAMRCDGAGDAMRCDGADGDRMALRWRWRWRSR